MGRCRGRAGPEVGAPVAVSCALLELTGVCFVDDAEESGDGRVFISAILCSGCEESIGRQKLSGFERATAAGVRRGAIITLGLIDHAGIGH